MKSKIAATIEASSVNTREGELKVTSGILVGDDVSISLDVQFAKQV